MQKFAVFGNPISHSISPKLHNYAISRFGIDAFYGRVLLDDGTDLKSKFLKLGLSGANITLPFKSDAMGICDILSDEVREIGSLNTLLFKNSKFYGFNTDAAGFYNSIIEFGKISNALIIGAGGTTKAISYILNKNLIKFDILNRSQKEHNLKCENFYTYENFHALKYDLIINATSAGLKDENLPAPPEILDEIFKHSNFTFDVIYGKITPFLAMAKRYDLESKDGLDMLINQAVLAFEIFFERKFEYNEIRKYMKYIASLSR